MNGIKTYFLLTALLAANLSGVEPAKNAGIIGQWVFTYKGEKRPFQFNKENTFSGRYALSGKPFTGTWRMDGTKVILIRDGKPGDWGSITFRMADEAELQAEGYPMSGRRAKL